MDRCTILNPGVERDTEGYGGAWRVVEGQSKVLDRERVIVYRSGLDQRCLESL